MAVLRSKRKIAQSEFEHSFSELYQFSMTQTVKVPTRRRKWLCPEIDSKMNSLYIGLMHINDIYFRNKNDRIEYASGVVKQYIHTFNTLEKPLMVLWNVCRYDTGVMARWVAKIKQEVRLLNLMHDDEDIPCEVTILDWQAINNATFLKTMSELHRYTHGKVTNAHTAYDDTEGALLISLVNNAFYELILANKKIPETNQEYERRRQHISNSITYLKEMNRPMLFYFNLMQYSERIMTEWSDLLVSELKMLASLQRSDKERFKTLT